MATNIEWAEETWNPITGCSPISEGCANCYAARMANRLRGRCGYDNNEPFKITKHLNRFDEPMSWRKPRMVFVCSMGDLFHDGVRLNDMKDVFEAIAAADRKHTFMILTKRPARLAEFMDKWVPYAAQFTNPHAGVLPNVWLGVTAENQERANERIPILLKIPAAVRFVSVEPMLGPIDLLEVPGLFQGDGHDMPWLKKDALHWVICGGETGPKARRMEYEWADNLQDQCEAEGIPFFFKKPGSAAYIPDKYAQADWQGLEGVRQFPDAEQIVNGSILMNSDEYLTPLDVDRYYRWLFGTARRLAKRGKLPHVIDPRGEIMFRKDVLNLAIDVPVK